MVAVPVIRAMVYFSVVTRLPSNEELRNLGGAPQALTTLWSVEMH
jgi:hypothetical protein